MIWGGVDVIIIEIKYTVNVLYLNHPRTIPPICSPWKNCLPWSWSLVSKKVGDHCLRWLQEVSSNLCWGRNPWHVGGQRGVCSWGFSLFFSFFNFKSSEFSNLFSLNCCQVWKYILNRCSVNFLPYFFLGSFPLLRKNRE